MNWTDRFDHLLFYCIPFSLIQVAAVREGLSLVIPLPLLSLCSSGLVERLICGNEELDIELLKKIAK